MSDGQIPHRWWHRIFPVVWYERAVQEEELVKAETERRAELVRREVKRLRKIQEARRA
jgi:hypothetical protein